MKKNKITCFRMANGNEIYPMPLTLEECMKLIKIETFKLDDYKLANFSYYITPLLISEKKFNKLRPKHILEIYTLG